MLKETLVAMRDLPRLREISAILIRHGLGEFAQRLKLPKAMERATEWLRVPLPDPEEFIETRCGCRAPLKNWGQPLSSLARFCPRGWMFPPDWLPNSKTANRRPAAAARGAATPGCSSCARATRTRCLPSSTTRPSAAPRLSSNRARLHDGTPVAVKVRRPGIAETIEADLRILSHLAYLVGAGVSPDTRRYQPGEMINQFAKSLRRELDLAAEARNMERFAQHLPTTR